MIHQYINERSHLNNLELKLLKDIHLYQ